MTADPLDHSWDAIVVGTGMGGGIAGRALAERGLSVLFLEKGRAGWRTEETKLDTSMGDPLARVLRGAWPEPVDVSRDGDRQSFYAPLGCGVGGSSVFYAATLERPEPRDLDGIWPVPYAELQSWYDRAESILSVHGEADPLSDIQFPSLKPPPPLNPADARIMAQLRANGMHPYRLHAALRYLPGCVECLGRKCPRPCKMDGRSAGVEPALATNRVALVEECEVQRVVGTTNRVTGVVACRGGQSLTIRAPRVILAAGAFSTPRLLLASASEAWPRGCGNGAGIVGRHLMLHLNEMFAIWISNDAEVRSAGPSKAIGLRDLMMHDGKRLGMVQALGVDAGEPEILYIFRQKLATHALGRNRLMHEGARLPARIAARALGKAKLFVGLLEDFPNPDNRVILDPLRPSRIVAEYHVPIDLEARRAIFRRSIKEAFRGLRPLFLNHAAAPNWGHACGTTRMGVSPIDSVVDPFYRVHGVENLWIADAGVFRTSLGVNPSLTIAANSLRLAENIASARGTCS